MTARAYHLIDKNTGEEVFASTDFQFADRPLPNHRINDAVLREHYGAPAIVDRVEDQDDGSIHVFIDGSEEVMNDDLVDPDQSYRRS